MYRADEMVPKREKSQVNSIHKFIMIYHATDTVHVNAGAIRKFGGLFACTSDNPLS